MHPAAGRCPPPPWRPAYIFWGRLARRAPRPPGSVRGFIHNLSLPREADLGVAHPVDGAGPDRIRAAGAVERDGLEVEQLAVRAAADALGADRPALHRDGVDDGEGCEGSAAVGALE